MSNNIRFESNIIFNIPLAIAVCAPTPPRRSVRSSSGNGRRATQNSPKRAEGMRVYIGCCPLQKKPDPCGKPLIWLEGYIAARKQQSQQHPSHCYFWLLCLGIGLRRHAAAYCSSGWSGNKRGNVVFDRENGPDA